MRPFQWHRPTGRGFLLFLLLTLLIPAGSTSAAGSGGGEGASLYLIQLEEPPLATYQGTVRGFSATNPAAAGTRRLDVHAAAVQAYAARLGDRRSAALAGMKGLLGRSPEVPFQFEAAANGFAVRLSPAEAARVARLPGVVRVQRDRTVHLRQPRGSEQPLAMNARRGTLAGGAGWLLAGAFLSLVALVIRRRRRDAWGWLTLAGILLLTAACGGDGGGGLIVPSAVQPSSGAAWIGAQKIWTGEGTGGLPGTMGEGIVVGIIDSGITPLSPSFAAVGGDGYVHANPRGKFFGVCDPDNGALYNPNFPCNDKLIGAWSFVSDDFNDSVGNPVDFNGHGTHVAATAAGNVVPDAMLHTNAGFNLTLPLSGVAPHANLISYRVMDANGSGTGIHILAGIEQAIQDGVDVLNISLGGGTSDPWQDTIYGQPLLAARAAGIAVAVAAGNEGPGAVTVDSPGVLPWVTTVGAGTDDTTYLSTLSLSGGEAPPEPIAGQSISPGYGPAPIVAAGDYADPFCLGNFSAPFHGEIVVCDRGENGRVEKGDKVKENGGGGMVLAEVDPGISEAQVADPHDLPAVYIGKGDADRLKAWLARGGEPVATIAETAVGRNDRYADRIAGFSSRGWNAVVPGIVKPDLFAPGTNVIAPVIGGIGYGMMSGTSMASPHVAGVYALLKALHPDWTPTQMQSAVMTTALPATVVSGEADPTPFDAGAGRIAADAAARAALVLDETADGFTLADPQRFWSEQSSGRIGDPGALNLASLGDGACIGHCSWTRVVRSVASRPTAWTATVSADSELSLTVTPEHFTLAPGESVELQVTAELAGVPLEAWRFGRLLLREANDAAPAATFPVAVRSLQQHLPTAIDITAAGTTGSITYHRLELAGGGDLTTTVQGLVPATVVEDHLGPDPTRDDFTNGDGGVYLASVQVPEGAALLVDLSSTDSPDMDLFAGMDGSWQPLASSAGPDATESLTILAPQAGTWWILVHNFDQEARDDAFTLRYGIPGSATGDRQNLSVAANRTDESPFNLSFSWNLPTAAAGDVWYGLLRFETSPASPEDVGTLPIRWRLQP